MGTEIERKFLVINSTWKPAAKGVRIRQGYLNVTPHGGTVRVRTMDDRAYITVKGPTQGLTRSEYEYEIPLADAVAILNELVTGNVLIKTRYSVLVDGIWWIIDEFDGDNAGLCLAEIELDAEDQPITLPAWVGEEVSCNASYTNAALSQSPYRTWSANNYSKGIQPTVM